VNESYIETEIRQVSSFERVSILGNTCRAQVFINQGEQEGLTIEAPPAYLDRLRSEVKDGKLTVRLHGSWRQELVDALTTCLNRPHIVYRLNVRRLNSLEVQCAYRVQASRIETLHLRLRLNGTGNFKLEQLSAQSLDVHHSGAGILSISGQVEGQSIVIDGAGSYLALGLDSQQARVRLSGAGLARVRVRRKLDARLSGVGILEYSGSPTVSKRISGSGRVVRIANAGEQDHEPSNEYGTSLKA
jgi:hypothetical protein